MPDLKNLVFNPDNQQIKHGGVFKKIWTKKKETVIPSIELLSFVDIFTLNAINNYDILTNEYITLKEYWEKIKSDMVGDYSIETKILEVLEREYIAIKKFSILLFELQNINGELLSIIGEREWLGWIHIYGYKISIHHILGLFSKDKLLKIREGEMTLLGASPRGIDDFKRVIA